MYFDVDNSAAALLRAVLVAVALTALTPFAAFAQGEETPGELPASPLELLLEHRAALALTTDQMGSSTRFASARDAQTSRSLPR